MYIFSVALLTGSEFLPSILGHKWWNMESASRILTRIHCGDRVKASRLVHALDVAGRCMCSSTRVCEHRENDTPRLAEVM